MASELFHQLYDKARQREHALIHDVQRLWHAMEMDDLQAAHRLAASLQEPHEDFLDGLEPVARRMGVNLRESGCPHCGDPHCPGNSITGEVIMVSMKNILGGLLGGLLNPPEPPEDQQE